MSEHVLATIALVQSQVADAERDLGEKKRMVNNLCQLIGQPPIYPDAEKPVGGTNVGIRSDEFYGQALAKVVRKILEKRKAANLGAASVNEIFDAMRAGGYDFGDTEEANAKRNLRISLTKNSSIFHRLPGHKYGMLSWYPNVKPQRPTNGDSADDEEDESARETMKEEFGDSPSADGDKKDKEPQATKK